MCHPQIGMSGTVAADAVVLERTAGAAAQAAGAGAASTALVELAGVQAFPLVVVEAPKEQRGNAAPREIALVSIPRIYGGAGAPPPHEGLPATSTQGLEGLTQLQPMLQPSSQGPPVALPAPQASSRPVRRPAWRVRPPGPSRSGGASALLAPRQRPLPASPSTGAGPVSTSLPLLPPLPQPQSLSPQQRQQEQACPGPEPRAHFAAGAAGAAAAAARPEEKEEEEEGAPAAVQRDSHGDLPALHSGLGTAHEEAGDTAAQQPTQGDAAAWMDIPPFAAAQQRSRQPKRVWRWQPELPASAAADDTASRPAKRGRSKSSGKEMQPAGAQQQQPPAHPARATKRRRTQGVHQPAARPAPAPAPGPDIFSLLLDAADVPAAAASGLTA